MKLRGSLLILMMLLLFGQDIALSDGRPAPVRSLRQKLNNGTNIQVGWGPPLNTGSALMDRSEVRHRKYTDPSNKGAFGNWFSVGLQFEVSLPVTDEDNDKYDIEVRVVNHHGLFSDAKALNGLTLASGTPAAVSQVSGPLCANPPCTCIQPPCIGAVDALPSVSSEERSRIANALAMDRVIFNELRNATTDTHDWVELRNVSNADVTLDGWQVHILTDAGTGIVTFPSGTVLPPGGLLLLLNTAPEAPEMPLSNPDGNVVSLVDAGLILPQTSFTLLLRSDTGWEDSAGNYFFGYEIPPTGPPLTTDAAWYRARPDVPGYQAEAWGMSGYQDGIGYDAGFPAASALGTPGSPHTSLMGDVNADGIVNILDLVFIASHFGETGVTATDLNGDGTVNIQDLVMVANGLGSVAAAPSAQALHASHVQQWVASAKQAVTAHGMQPSVVSQLDAYDRGIQVLEQLLATLVPKSTMLLANYPNPFNPETWIPYRLAKSSDVQLRIYDTQGRLMRHLDIGHQAAGVYQTRSRAAYWDGTNAMGETVASGLYFYTLTAGDFSATRRMLILK